MASRIPKFQELVMSRIEKLGAFNKWCFVALLFSMGTFGCVTNGENFPSSLEWLKTDVTKKPDVRQILGDPYSVGNSSGRVTWTYGFYRYKLIGDSYTKELKIYWNDNGSVSSFSFNSSFPEDKRRL
jgi:hypothetical protein